MLLRGAWNNCTPEGIAVSLVQTERVLVVPTEVFRSLGYFQGFSHDAHQILDELIQPSHAQYRARGEMESDPSFKQLIPYMIFRHVDSSGQVSVFRYTRGGGQGEARLRAKHSVGVGGHICIDDAGGVASREAYHEGMRRELDEEVIVEAEYQQKCVGMINDDQTDVGRVHLGIVHLADVAEPNIRPREEDIIQAEFQPVEQILENLDGYETWSQICLTALFGDAAK
jgi:predicted NUDIX family phosphoesterase